MTDGNGTSSYGFGASQKFELDPALIARFLAAAGDILARTMEINPAQFPDLAPRLATALFAARLLEPKVAQYQPALLEKWPALISRLHAATAEASRDGISRTLDNMAREQQQSASPDTSDRVKGILERAEKTADFARRDELYAQAAQEARRGGDIARSLSIADKISDMDYRQKVRDWLNFNASSDALNDNRPEDARRYAIDVGATDQCAYLLFQIAASALKARDRARAIDLLEEAARRASDAANTIEKLRALLGIANLYVGIDPSRAFDIASEAVKTANKVSAYSLDQARLVRVLERPSGGSVSVSTSDVDGFDIGKTLAVLARSDFERTLSLAQSLENKSLQLTTIVTVATTLIDQKPSGQ
jgi:tetratricopeptide (TPR) repeat protein